MQICDNNGLNADDLFYKWEAANFKMTPRVVNTHSISEVRQMLERDATKAKAKRTQGGAGLTGRQSKNLAPMGRFGIKIEPKAVSTTIRAESRSEAGPSRVRLVREDKTSFTKREWHRTSTKLLSYTT